MVGRVRSFAGQAGQGRPEGSGQAVNPVGQAGGQADEGRPGKAHLAFDAGDLDRDHRPGPGPGPGPPGRLGEQRSLADSGVPGEDEPNPPRPGTTEVSKPSIRLSSAVRPTNIAG